MSMHRIYGHDVLCAVEALESVMPRSEGRQGERGAEQPRAEK